MISSTSIFVMFLSVLGGELCPVTTQSSLRACAGAWMGAFISPEWCLGGEWIKESIWVVSALCNSVIRVVSALSVEGCILVVAVGPIKTFMRH